MHGAPPAIKPHHGVRGRPFHCHHPCLGGCSACHPLVKQMNAGRCWTSRRAKRAGVYVPVGRLTATQQVLPMLLSRWHSTTGTQPKASNAPRPEHTLQQNCAHRAKHGAPQRSAACIPSARLPDTTTCPRIRTTAACRSGHYYHSQLHDSSHALQPVSHAARASRPRAPRAAKWKLPGTLMPSSCRPLPASLPSRPEAGDHLAQHLLCAGPLLVIG